MRIVIVFVGLLLTTLAAHAQDGQLIMFSAASDDPARTDFSRITGEWVVESGLVYTQFVHVYAGQSGATADVHLALLHTHAGHRSELLRIQVGVSDVVKYSRRVYRWRNVTQRNAMKKHR